MALLIFCCCCSENLFAQATSPLPQQLPYSQDFETLAAGSTTYPIGFQGWAAVNTSPPGPGSVFATSASMPENRALISTTTANTTSSSSITTSGNIHNYNGKIGFLNSGSLDLAIGFAFSTTGKKDIEVQYDAMVIRNPFDATNTRINEMVLQYRIGDTTPFTSILSTAYKSTNVNQVTPATTNPQNLKKIKVHLPAECNNQQVIQIRWISRQDTGGGSRPSFAIDNISVKEDVLAPISVAGYPKADNILSESFVFSDKLDELGKTYYVLLPGGSTAPTAAQVKAGNNANDVAALQSGFFNVTDISQVYATTFSGLSLNTTYSVFSISEDIFGNIQVNPTKVDATISSVLIPSIVTTVSSLDLGFSEPNLSSDKFSYQIQGNNIATDVTVTATTNFTVSKDGTTFTSSVLYAASEFASNATPTVYVQSTPNALGSFSGQITHETTGATTKNVTLTSAGINPYEQGFNDPNVLTNSGWTQYNVAGPLNKWVSTTVARNINSGTGAVIMNGFSETGASKDWLISPRLRLDNTAKFDKSILLSFYSRKFYAGTDLKLMVSTNYDGKSSPETAIWTELDGKFPTTTGAYVQSQYIKIEDAYKTNHTYLAWVYETTAGGTNNAAEWSFDDVSITNEAGYVDLNPNLNFGVVNKGNTSAAQSFVFKAEGYGDITITAPADYQLSLDNTSFQSAVIVNAADALSGKTIYARFVPSVKTLTISGALIVSGTSLNKKAGFFTGSSLPKEDTFDIVTYNLEFFGSDVIGADGKEFGPTDNVLQVENVAKVMIKLDADVYAVQEVSDEPSLDALIKKISVNGKTFDKVISPKWSYSFNPPQDNFPPQKLVIIYNTKTTTIKKTRVMFSKLFDDARANAATLPGYPGSAANFFSSGRLPYMVDIETNIGGVKKELTIIDLHARANSGTDVSKYNMRKYDAELLKDSLDANYPDTNFVILGDFNDDVKKTVVNDVLPSSYEKLVKDTDRYNALTMDISKAGAFSFLSSGGFLDHIMISNELNDQYIQNSTAVYDPRTEIANYTTTTSDHGPVIARFQLTGNLSTIDFETKNGYLVQAFPNPATDVLNVVVKTNTDKSLKLKIYDISGHLVSSSIQINATQDLSTTAIPVSHLSSGIYVYTLSENNKVVYKGKIIKK